MQGNTAKLNRDTWFIYKKIIICSLCYVSLVLMMLANYYFLQFCYLVFSEALKSWFPVIYTLSNCTNVISARKNPSELLSLQEDVTQSAVLFL